MSDKPANSSDKHLVNTAEFAKACGVTPDTVRRNAAVNGSYFGITPVRRPNGRLAWPLPLPR